MGYHLRLSSPHFHANASACLRQFAEGADDVKSSGSMSGSTSLRVTGLLVVLGVQQERGDHAAELFEMFVVIDGLAVARTREFPPVNDGPSVAPGPAVSGMIRSAR
jgi:hypothetical protein